MAQTNYTPISLYYSATASNVPVNTNLVAGELAINTNDGKLFYKDSSGVVQVLATKGGVGTSSTTQVLYNSSGLVVGSANLTFDGTNLATTGTATATRFIPSGSTVATNGMFLPAANTLGFSTASTERMRIDSSGNVGIGTTSTSNYKLNVASSVGIGASANGTSALYFNGAIGGDSINAGSFIQGTYTAYGTNSAGALIFGTNPSTTGAAEAMRIDSSGNLLVACTGLPTGSVGGISLSSPATSNGMLLGTTGTGATNMIRFYNPNGNVGAITTSGSLTTYAVSSDYRLKENLASLENAKEFILSLKPKQGNWKADGSKFVGFVAHEFAQTSPTSVIGEKDAVDEEGKPVYQSMQASSSEVMANLISLVQEQQALIESLTTRLTALESK